MVWLLGGETKFRVTNVYRNLRLRDFIPLSVLVPDALGALFIDYFMCNDISIKMNDLINSCGYKQDYDLGYRLSVTKSGETKFIPSCNF